jgi:hypothetical protein
MFMNNMNKVSGSLLAAHLDALDDQLTYSTVYIIFKKHWCLLQLPGDAAQTALKTANESICTLTEASTAHASHP